MISGSTFLLYLPFGQTLLAKLSSPRFFATVRSEMWFKEITYKRDFAVHKSCYQHNATKLTLWKTNQAPQCLYNLSTLTSTGT